MTRLIAVILVDTTIAVAKLCVVGIIALGQLCAAGLRTCRAKWNHK